MNAGELKVVLKLDDGKFKASLLDAEGNVRSFGGEAEKTTKSVEKTDSALAGLAKRGAKFAAVGLGVLGTAVAGLAVKGGISRALNIEDAQAKLRGLGHDAGNVSAIMDNALSSVKGTAFGLDAAATSAAGAVAAGIKPGKQLEKVLKTVANTAALAGADMGEMGAIFNKVATSNKVQMDVINQLGDRGIPVLQFLSKEMGVSAEETAKLASAGKINFETFARAMEKGVGNAAEEMGKTTRGSWSNLLAALSRLGAGIVSGPIESVRFGFGWLTDFIDEYSKTIINAVTSVFDTFQILATGQFNSGMFGGALQEDSKYVDLLFDIRDSIGRVKDVIGDMGSTLASGDYSKLGEQIGSGLSKSVEVAFKGLSIGADTIKNWFAGVDWGKVGADIGTGALAFIVGLITGLFSPEAFNSMLGFIANNWQAVLISAVSIALLPAKFLGPIGSLMTKIFGPIGKIFKNLIVGPLRSLGEPIRAALSGVFRLLSGAVSGVVANIGNIFKTVGLLIVTPFKLAIDFIANLIWSIPLSAQQVFTSIVFFARTALTTLWGVFSTIFTSIVNVIKLLLQPLTAFFGGIWNAIKAQLSGLPSTFGAIFTAAWNFVRTAFSTAISFFQGIWIGITNIFSAVSGWFGGVFRGAWNAITSVFSNVRGFFSGVWNTIVSVFGSVGSAVGNAIGGTFKSVINGVLRGAIGIVNGFIRSINNAVGAINKIPGVNIGKLGELGIPQLATGGIVTGPTLALIGEGSESEAVLPLSKLKALLDENGSDNINNEPIEITQNVYPQTPIDMNVINRSLMREARRA